MKINRLLPDATSRARVRFSLLHAVLLLALVSVATVALASPGSAEGGEVKVDLQGAVLRDGKLVSVADTQVFRGEEIVWTVSVTNRGRGAAHNLNATGAVPQGTALVPGSATGAGLGRVTYSVDGGKTFSPRPVIRVREAGVEKEIIAPTDAYTDVMFAWGRLDAGATARAEYRTRVR